MKQKVIQTIKKYNLINSGDKIILGVSGGPDSIAMLDILRQLMSELKFDIFVVHINHNIRGKDADEDEKYVKNIGNYFPGTVISIKFFIDREYIEELKKNE